MEQQFNEALLKLCMLIYRVDGKITLSEQDYYQAIYSNVDWHGEEDLEEFERQSIHQVRQVVDSGNINSFLLSLKEPLSFNAKKALTVAQGIAHIDGEIAEQELEILEFLQNRLLAKALS